MFASPTNALRRLIRPRPASSHRTPRHEIAIAHDYLTQRGGAERVVLALHRIFPDAPIYTTLYDPEGTFPEFRDARIITSPLNRVGLLRRHHRLALPLLPLASSLLRVLARLSIVSTTGWAHGFRFAGDSLIYCHSPARWIYLSDQYLGDRAGKGPVSWVLAALLPFLRRWDQKAAHRHEGDYLANSSVVRDRIRSVYGIEAPVVFPSHSVDVQAPVEAIDEVPWDGTARAVGGTGEFFVIVSRLLPYKNVQPAVEAFRDLPEQNLLVIGAGPLYQPLRAQAPANVRVVRGLTDAQMRWAYSRARAVLAVSYEDFGITPLEAGAYGKPVIALRAGGFLDTLREGVTGAFIDEPTAPAIREAVQALDPRDYDAERIREHARTFGLERFEEQLREQLRRRGMLSD